MTARPRTQLGVTSPVLDDPVAKVDVRRVRAQCERVRSEFHRLYEWIPVRPLSGEGVARWSGLKGPLCRRVLAAIRHHGEPADLARILPGVEGLTLFVDALERKGCPRARTEPARQAIRAFAELLHESGGSQRQLLAALRESMVTAAAGAEAEGEGLATRRKLHEAARALTGSALRAMAVVSIVHRASGRAGELDTVGAFGQLGYSARADAAPLMVRRFAQGGGDELPSEGGLQERFGTSGLTVRRTRLGDGRYLVSYDTEQREAPIDVWTGPVRDSGVVILEPGGENVYGSLSAIRTPTRTLVHDLWVETPLARASVLRAGAYRSSPDFVGGIDYDRWYDRLPGEPGILMPGSDLRAGVERILPRHPDVLAECFDCAGLDRADFVGYRCVVEYPVWMAIYRLTLEFDPAFVSAGA